MAELMMRWIERDKEAAGKSVSSRVKKIFAKPETVEQEEKPKSKKPKSKKSEVTNEESTKG